MYKGGGEGIFGRCFLKFLKIIQFQLFVFLEEDIREVLKEEIGIDIFFKEEDEFVYKSCKQEVILSIVYVFFFRVSQRRVFM